MKSAYAESVVPMTKSIGFRILKGVLITLLVICGLFASMFLSRSLLIVLAILAVAAVFGFFLLKVLRKTDSEYEYIHQDDTFLIDIVICNSRRKSLRSVTLDDVVLLAPEGHPSLDKYKHLHRRSFAGCAAAGERYAMVSMSPKYEQILLLSLNAKMLESLKTVLKKRVEA